MVNRLVTLLVIMANICAGALLLFHLFGWMKVSAEQVNHAIGYTAAGVASVILLVAVSNDIFQGNRRLFGIAIFLSALWIAAAPTMGIKSLRGQMDAFFPSLNDHRTLIICLYLLIISRMAVFGQRAQLGYALGLLATVILSLQARMMGGPVYADVFYGGLLTMMGAFTVMLGMGYQQLASSAIVAAVTLGCAYLVVT